MLTCKHCGKSTKFKAKITKGAVVEVQPDGSFTLVQESQKFSVEPVQCIGCGAKLNGMADLCEPAVECPDCKTMHDPATMIDGLCPTCYAKKNRPDILNMTQEEMIRKMIELEKLAAQDKVVAKDQKAQEAVESVKEKVEEAAKPAATTNKKGTRGGSKKAKEEATPQPDPLAEVEAQTKGELGEQPVQAPVETVPAPPEEAVSQESVEANAQNTVGAPPSFEDTPF